MKAKRLFYGFCDLFALAAFAYLLAFPEEVSRPVKYALTFCAGTLIPSLFVYMVLARVISGFPAVRRAMERFGCGPVLLLLGTLCGSPVGASVAYGMYEKGQISKKYAEYLCGFTNGASVSFLVGAAGAGIFGDAAFGVRLALYQLFASAVTALALKLCIFGFEKGEKPEFGSGTRVGLREAITGSAETMIGICACAVFFITVAGAVNGVIGSGGVLGTVIGSLFEFSSGCASAGGLSGRTAKALCAFSCGHGGLSVFLQIRSVTEGRLSATPYLAGKAVNCMVMTALAFFIG